MPKGAEVELGDDREFVPHWGNSPLSEVDRVNLGFSRPTPGAWYQIIDKQRWLTAQTLPVVIKPRLAENPVPNGPIRYIRIYWIVGGCAHGNAVDDAPVAGWQNALVIQEPGSARALIFCPFSLRSFDVPADAAEITTSIDLTAKSRRVRVAEMIARGWMDAAERKHFPADMRAATVILRRLGADAPAMPTDETPKDDGLAAEIRRAKHAERMRLIRRNEQYRDAEKERDRAAKRRHSVHVRRAIEPCTESPF